MCLRAWLINDSIHGDYSMTSHNKTEDECFNSLVNWSWTNHEYYLPYASNSSTTNFQLPLWYMCIFKLTRLKYDAAAIGRMRYTHGPMPRSTCCSAPLQIFFIKITELKGDLAWPLDVFGFVAVRDSVDHNRNLLFNRSSASCHTLTAEVLVATISSNSLTMIVDQWIFFHILCITTPNDDISLFLDT